MATGRSSPKMHIGLLVALISLAAFAWYGTAYLLADTGVPGTVPARTEALIYAGMGLILGLAGWIVVWRREAFVPDRGGKIEEKRALFWGYVAVIIFWGAAAWFLWQAFIS
ncbi:MAG: hypothetical protein WEA61_04875 [Anaerolineales bacterium]